MSKTPLIFISYHSKYAPLMEFFLTLVNDIGFRADPFDFPSSMTVLEKQQEMIESCDGFLALLTPDEQTADGRFICSSAVTTEIGMALGAGKTIQQFAFNGVDFTANQGSQANTVARIDTLHKSPDEPIAFDAKNVRQIIRALLDFKHRIESYLDASSTGNDDSFFLYRRFAVKQDILSDTELRLHNEIEAFTLKPLDSHTHDAMLLCDRGNGDGVRLDDEKFQFKFISPQETTYSIRKPVNDYSSFRFLIDFDPPLPVSTDVKYAYRRSHFNYFPFTVEELQSIIAEGKVSNRVMADRKMIGQDLFITQPTEEIEISMTFPAGYPIRNYQALACEIRGDLINRSETERAGEFVQLDHNEFDDVYTLKMTIPKPRMNCTYFLLYTPPSERDVQHLLNGQSA
ncbi:MAG: hypothetical protein AAF456_23500 [Planctomycetota bacterium]